MGFHFGKTIKDWIETGRWWGADHSGLTLSRMKNRYWGVSIGPWLVGVSYKKIDYANQKVTVHGKIDGEVQAELRRMNDAIKAGHSKPLIFDDAPQAKAGLQPS